MKKALALAAAGALAGQAARHAWQAHRAQASQSHADECPRWWQPGYPHTWAETRDAMLWQAKSSARGKVLTLLYRAGVPVPVPRPRRLYGTQAVTQIILKRHDQWDEDG